MNSGFTITVPDSVEKTYLGDVPVIRGHFDKGKVNRYMSEVFTQEEIAAMKREGVDKRMVVGINPHYYALAVGGGLKLEDGTELVPDMPPSSAILALIMPRLGETMDMEGQQDPSNQMKYTPKELEGKLLHKYDEIVLAYSAFACSAHCRYCYRLDLFNRSTGKEWVRPEELRDYVIGYNKRLKENGGIDPKNGKKRYPVREILLSGGDPMVMSNAKLFKFLSAAAQSGVKTVRIGTKEIAFRPERFDDKLVGMLKTFNQQYPDVHVNFVVHFSHPDEFLVRDAKGNYIQGDHGYKWMKVSEDAVRRIASLPFASMENQSPMISRVNDNADALRILHEELRQHGVKPKYIFQCREIEGHRSFSVPLQEAWRIHNESQKGLSDTSRSRFVMSAEHGKTEVVSVINGPEDKAFKELPAKIRPLIKDRLKDGLVLMKVHRSPSDTDVLGDAIIARGNPKALWLTGYEDRILFDCRKKGLEQFAGFIDFLSSDASVTSSEPEQDHEVIPFPKGEGESEDAKVLTQ